MVFKGKRVAVIGAAKTGVAVAKALVPRGARVHVYDRSTSPEVMEAAVALRALGADVTLGANEGPELREADIIVPSPGVWKRDAVLQGAKERGQTVWSEPEVAWRISEAPILGITGTNGKTTTTALLGAMLCEAGLDARVGGNIAPGRPLIDLAAEAPASAVLVAEVSSFQMEWIEGFRPKVGILTNITEDHLNRHGMMDEYAAMKARLFENQTADEHTVVNADNARAARIGRESPGTLWTFSRTGEVERGAFLRGTAMVLRDGERETEIGDVRGIRIPGGHNQENAMAAAIAAKICGLDADNVYHTLTRFPGVEHRMEWVGSAGGVDWINNSMCTNPAALIGSIRAVERPLVLITGGLDKDLDFSGAPAAFARCKAVLTIGAFGPRMAAMARAGGVACVVESGTLANAVVEAARLAEAGDVVMLAPGCASMDQFRNFEERGHQFKAAVREMMGPGC